MLVELVGVEIVPPVPLIMVQVPVPELAVFPDKVAELLHFCS